MKHSTHINRQLKQRCTKTHTQHARKYRVKDKRRTLRGCKPALSSRAWRSSASLLLLLLSEVADVESTEDSELLLSLLFWCSFFSVISISSQILSEQTKKKALKSFLCNTRTVIEKGEGKVEAWAGETSTRKKLSESLGFGPFQIFRGPIYVILNYIKLKNSYI